MTIVELFSRVVKILKNETSLTSTSCTFAVLIYYLSMIIFSGFYFYNTHCTEDRFMSRSLLYYSAIMFCAVLVTNGLWLMNLFYKQTVNGNLSREKRVTVENELDMQKTDPPDGAKLSFRSNSHLHFKKVFGLTHLFLLVPVIIVHPKLYGVATSHCVNLFIGATVYLTISVIVIIAELIYCFVVLSSPGNVDRKPSSRGTYDSDDDFKKPLLPPAD